MRKAYLAIKYCPQNSNRLEVESIAGALSMAGIEVKILVRDYEKWGKVKFSPNDLMNQAFKVIDECDFIIVEFSEKGTGRSIEAGYAKGINKPVIIIAQEGTDIPIVMQGIAEKIIFYNDPEELIQKFKGLKL